MNVGESPTAREELMPIVPTWRLIIKMKLGSHRGIRGLGDRPHCPLVGYYG